MNPRVWIVGLVVAMLGLVACRGPNSYASDQPNWGLAGTDNDPDEPAPSPLAGAFYNEGGDGDVRARSEEALGRVTTFDDETNGLQSLASRRLESGRGATLDDITAGTPGEPKQKSAGSAARLLVYRGEIQVEVARPDDAIAQLLAQVKLWGGYLQNQQGTVVTVRLPAAHFDEAFVLLRGTGRVLGETRQADDVTEEFVDLGIRLDNARKARDRLLEVLGKADKVEDILKVEVELRRLTEEIERMEGRKKFLADQVAMASLQAGFSTAAEAPVAKRSRRPSRFGWINQIGAEWVMGSF